MKLTTELNINFNPNLNLKLILNWGSAHYSTSEKLFPNVHLKCPPPQKTNFVYKKTSYVCTLYTVSA